MRDPSPSPAPRLRTERGVVFPSPVVILTIVAIFTAGIAYLATQGRPPTEREVTITSAQPSATATPSMPTATPEKHQKPAIDKGKVYVEVYNNSGVTGLAGRISATATQAGWKVVGTDNWYGTIPASTVYYPAKLARAAKALALDLGIRRTAPAADPMKLDRLTVILTSDHA